MATCNIHNPGGTPCSKDKGHDAGHDETAYGPPPHRIFVPRSTSVLMAVSPELENVPGEWYVPEDFGRRHDPRLVNALDEITTAAASLDNQLHAGFELRELHAERSRLYQAVNTAKAVLHDVRTGEHPKMQGPQKGKLMTLAKEMMDSNDLDANYAAVVLFFLLGSWVAGEIQVMTDHVAALGIEQAERWQGIINARKSTEKARKE